MTDNCSGVGRRELEADSGISRTDDSLRNDESSEHELIDTDSASPSSGSTKYDRLTGDSVLWSVYIGASFRDGSTHGLGWVGFKHRNIKMAA